MSWSSMICCGRHRVRKMVVAEGRPLKRVARYENSLANAEDSFQVARDTVRRGGEKSPRRSNASTCRGRVTMPYEEGARFERESFLQRCRLPESRALRMFLR